jgi:hypothetical protein
MVKARALFQTEWALYVGDADRRFAFVGQIVASTRHSVGRAREPRRTGARVKREDAWTGVGCGRRKGAPRSCLGFRRGLNRVPSQACARS